MALTEQTVTLIDGIAEDGAISVRRVIRHLRNGVVVSEEPPHRHVVYPGNDLDREDSFVREVGTVVHKPAVVAAWQAAENARNAGSP